MQKKRILTCDLLLVRFIMVSAVLLLRLPCFEIPTVSYTNGVRLVSQIRFNQSYGAFSSDFLTHTLMWIKSRLVVLLYSSIVRFKGIHLFL